VSLGYADALEDFQCLLRERLGLGGVARDSAEWSWWVFC
jgi:hypothetical protein